MSQLVCIADLIGKSIAGVRADIRSRTADGALMYEHTAEQNDFMVTMKTAMTYREKSHRYGWQKWLRWEWEKRPNSFDCGFSGMVMDGEREREYYLLIEAPEAA